MATTRTMWVLLYPAQDVRDVWIAHCLDIDVVTQGKKGGGLHSAIESIVEAVVLTLASDIEGGTPPRAKAEKKEWDRLWSIVHGGELAAYSEIEKHDAKDVDAVATQIVTWFDEMHRPKVRHASAGALLHP